MVIVDSSTFSFSCICAVVEFYRFEFMLLAVLMKRCGCCETKAVVCLASFSEKSGSKRKALLNHYVCLARTFES